MYATEPRSIASSEVYALTDNRLISYRGDFCVNIRATSTQPEPRDLQSSATLAFLRSPPPLTGREVFNLSESASLNSVVNFNSWNFYLNYNSNISIEVCYRQSGGTDNSVTFLLIESKQYFELWLETPEDTRRTVRSIHLNERCTSISYRVVGAADYYFVFYLNGERSRAIDIQFHFNRTLYEVSSDMVVKNCSFPLDGRSGCTLDAPMTPGYTGFLSLNTNPPVNYNDGAGISISCSSRGWLYAVIVIVVVLVATCLLCVFVVVCYSIPKKDTDGSEIEAVNLRIASNLATQSNASRHERSAVSTDHLPVKDQAPSIPADSVLLKDEPPSYSDAVEYSTNIDVPPPSYTEL